MKLRFFKKQNKTVFRSYIQLSMYYIRLLEQEDRLEKQVWGLTSGQNQIPALFPGPSHLLGTCLCWESLLLPRETASATGQGAGFCGDHMYSGEKSCRVDPRPAFS